ncbi:SMP-30/gluconolactonase/LRE family protein [Qipengyuania sp. 6B39]|uniref:SMP-30/gluconolactonase/LRE family protein n=1 Tax=Qipengyuania proteolytica TaxID=2867239 RepID=UPI001C8AABCC|nr:SMP-30/gluconolactonase/LRE family protein [Qipengyuania proteolytica]MBX7495776.1 SMP-30/gluconolactonase/LRE family protein [Qipengyuania proteolytica]
MLAGCVAARQSVGDTDASSVEFEAFDGRFAGVVDVTAPAKLLGSGYQWAEGPAWDATRQALYFTDVPANRAYRWSAGDRVEVFLDPSGAVGAIDGFREPGANGLLIARDGRLLLCNHGARAVESLDLGTGERATLASRFEGKRFNSPNDVIEARDGTIYFTDPPYGLEGLDASPLKEMDANGVYRLAPDGMLTRIISDMTFPNGVVLSTDGVSLFVSQSDPAAPLVRKLELDKPGPAPVWFDASPYTASSPGLPDGMAMAVTGHLFLAGPGGVLVIDEGGTCLGRIATGRATANCAFGEDGRTLFITAQDRLLAVRTRVRGLGM